MAPKKRDAETAGFPAQLRAICLRHSLPYSQALAARFERFYREVVCRLDYRNPSVTKIYMHAMVYRHTRTRRPKKDFLDGFRLRVFENAHRAVQGWLDADVQEDAPATPLVCNLYSVCAGSLQSSQ